jgi:hypothetical protein
MTYSYVRQAWVAEQINKEVFGIPLISRAAGIPAKTGFTWHRQFCHRLPANKKTPREYERALGILLYEKFPKSINHIAEIFATTPRMIREWEADNRLHWEGSDLKRQTHFLAEYMSTRIDGHFDVDSNQRIILTQGRWPDSSGFDEKFFKIQDILLYFLLETESNFRASRVIKSWVPFAKLMTPMELLEAETDLIVWQGTAIKVPMRGPHKYRYVQCNNNSQYPYSWGDTKPYGPGSLRGVNIGGHYDPSQPLRVMIAKVLEEYGDKTYEDEVLPKVVDLREYAHKQEEERQAKLQLRYKKAS